MEEDHSLGERSRIDAGGLLYVMHVDWGWAKQRPHFIAEHLAKFVRVEVRFPPNYVRSMNSEVGAPAGLEIKAIRRLPLARFRPVLALNRRLAKLQLARSVKRASVVWLTHPGLFGLVERHLRPTSTVVYDCMDDALEFPDTRHDADRRRRMSEAEGRLAGRADVVFASSSYLKSKLETRYGGTLKVHVVNNAIELSEGRDEVVDEGVSGISTALDAVSDVAGPKVVYVGTISEWFNFDLVVASLKKVPTLNFVLVGPCEVAPPTHERLFVVSPVEHRHVFRLMAWADALVMPFRLTELIRSVNPVKVYEYIYAHKPAVVLGYGETEKFEPFVHLYRNEHEFVRLMEDLVAGALRPKVDAADARRFVQANTWKARVGEIVPRLRAHRRSAQACSE